MSKQRESRPSADYAALEAGLQNDGNGYISNPVGQHGFDELLDPETLFYLQQVRVDLRNLLEKEQQDAEEEEQQQQQHRTGYGQNDETEEEAGSVILVRNTLEELKGHLNEVARDITGSRILEELIKSVVDLDLANLIRALITQGGTQRILRLAEHRCASHVFESVIKRTLELYQGNQSVGQPVENTGKKKNYSLEVSLSQKALIDLADMLDSDATIEMMRDERASHVIRSIFISLSGADSFEQVQHEEIESNLITRTRTRSGLRGSGNSKNQGASGSADSKLLLTSRKAALLVPVPAPCIQALQELTQKLVGWNSSRSGSLMTGNRDGQSDDAGSLSLNDLCVESPVSAALQVLLRSLAAHMESEQCSQTFIQLCHAISDHSRLHELCYNTAGSRLAECIIELMPREEFRQIFKKSFKGNLMEMARDSNANYVLQRLILVAAQPDEEKHSLMNAILKELLPHVEWMITSRRSGVVLSIAQAVVLESDTSDKHASKFIRALYKATGASKEENNLVPALLFSSKSLFDHWRKYLEKHPDAMIPLPPRKNASVDAEQQDEQYNYRAGNIGPRTSVVGSLIAQSLFRLPSVKRKDKIIQSLHGLNSVEVVALCADSCASHAMEAILEDSTIAFDQKVFVVNAIKEHLAPLACDRCGSRVVEKAFKASPLEKRRGLVRVMGNNKQALADNTYGRFIVRSCRVDQFLSRPDEWTKVEKANDAKQQMLDEILQKSASGQSRKKDAAVATKHKHKPVTGDHQDKHSLYDDKSRTQKPDGAGDSRVLQIASILAGDVEETNTPIKRKRSLDGDGEEPTDQTDDRKSKSDMQALVLDAIRNASKRDAAASDRGKKKSKKHYASRLY